MIKRHRKALNKIEKGKYGLCEVDKKQISKDRLIAFPEAEFCSKHAK
jgi:RNA polymerase-binding transcription factor DksA